jgi:hypothetical protein
VDLCELTPFRPAETPISIVYQRQRHVLPRVKALVATLTQQLAR